MPAPRLSRTPAIANISEKEPEVGQHTVDILSQELEYTSEDIKALLEAGIIECSNNSSKLWFLHEWLRTKQQDNATLNVIEIVNKGLINAQILKYRKTK